MIVGYKKRRAKITHKCELSGREIDRGSVYYVLAQKVGTIFFSIKICSWAKKTIDDMYDSCGNTIEEIIDRETFKYLCGNQ